MDDITCRRPISWVSAQRTDVGCVRKVNEDAILSLNDHQFWVVADGMGGHARGDVASKNIVTALESITLGGSMRDCVANIENTLINVNDQLIEYSDSMALEGMMGSTFISLLVNDEFATCLWVGDSRLYRYRNHKLAQISRDHSQVQEMLDMGMITPEQAENHPQGNVITRAVGVEAELNLDIEAFRILTGDTYLLCSDGLYNCIDEQSITQSLTHRDVQKCCDELIEKAIASGANDNVSVIVVRGMPGKLSL